jgi:hypothetical protein
MAAKGMDRVHWYACESRIPEVIRLIAEIAPEHHRIAFFCSHFNRRGNYTAEISVRFLKTAEAILHIDVQSYNTCGEN